MPCALYCNTGYTCSGCEHFNKSTSVEVTGSSVVVTIPNQVIHNRERCCVAITQCIPPTAASEMTVVISVDGTHFTLYEPYGNAVYADQLRSRKVLHLTLATDTLAAVAQGCGSLCGTYHSFPVIQLPAAATSTTTADITDTDTTTTTTTTTPTNASTTSTPGVSSK